MSNTATKRVISIDMDGVLSNFGAGFVKIINKRWPERDVPEDFEPNNWDYSEVLKAGEVAQLWPDIIASPLFWYKLPAYTENCRALGIFLRECWRDFNVYYITSRPDTKGGTALEQTGAWLKDRHLLNESTSIIVVREPKEKEHMIRGVGAFASIDDYGPTFLKMRGILNHSSFLLDRPWNREYEAGSARMPRFVDYLNCLLAHREPSTAETKVVLPPGISQVPGGDSEKHVPQSPLPPRTTSAGE